MGSKKIDKTKPKNWIDGDTFAVKIENTNTEYDGRYIVLNKYKLPEWSSKHPHFHIFLTLDKKLPVLEDLELLDKVKTTWRHYKERLLPFWGMESYEDLKKRKSHISFYPDEHNYLYSYTIELLKKRNDDYSDFIYLGNKEVSTYDEYQPICECSLSKYVSKKEIIEEVIKSYEDYNLKKSNIYDEHMNQLIDEKAEQHMAILIKLTEELPHYLETHKEQVEQWKREEKYDTADYHETYVGGDPNHKEYEDE